MLRSNCATRNANYPNCCNGCRNNSYCCCVSKCGDKCCGSSDGQRCCPTDGKCSCSANKQSCCPAVGQCCDTSCKC